MHEDSKKNNFTYIALLDDDSSVVVKNIQDIICTHLGHSEYIDQWSPHITLAPANSLSEEDVSIVLKKCQIVAKSFEPFYVEFENIFLHKKSVGTETFCSIRLKIKPNKNLDLLSFGISEITKEYEIPFDGFTLDHYHVGLARYKDINIIAEQKIQELVSIKNLPKIKINSFSLFYSMLNSPKPEKAIEVERFMF